MNDKRNLSTGDGLDELTKRLRNRAFDSSCCFLCAHHFEEADLTSEHVIPRWAQRRYDLWDQQLVLLNGSCLPYRNATVPCCEDCNKYSLQPIETAVASAVNKGPAAVRELGRNTLFLWLGKIFYGILYRELFLLLDRAAQDGITIATPDMLRNFETHLIFLQEAREKIKLMDFTPGSIYVFECQTPSDPKLQWDLCDNINTMFIGIRMGNVAVVGVLGDGGAQLIYEDVYRKLYDLPLHPIQFREICAHFSYRSTIANRTPKLFCVDGAPPQIFQLPLGGLSMKPYFNEWDIKDYSKLLSFYTGCPYELAFSPPDEVRTWLHTPDGNLNYMDFNKYPFLAGGEEVSSD